MTIRLCDSINNEAEIAEMHCFGHQPDLLEMFFIAVFELSPEFSKRLSLQGIDALGSNRKPHQQKDRFRTDWIIAGDRFDGIDSANGYMSRGIKFMVDANRQTKNVCGDLVTKLEREKARVSFIHAGKWKIENCTYGCTAFLIFPSSDMAVIASFD